MPDIVFHHGRNPNDSSKPRIRLTARFLSNIGISYDAAPAVDYYSKIPAATIGMDGNDRYGDCVFARIDHAVKAWQVAAGNAEVKSTTNEVLAAYSAVTGFDPNDPSSDQGTVMQDAQNYWLKSGITLGGKLNKILLFAEVDHDQLSLVRWSVEQFGEVGIGFNFPSSAMSQFNHGQPWDVVPGASNEGGHAVSLIGYDGTYFYVVTWGKIQKMTVPFFVKYVDEAWVQLTRDFVNEVTGNSPLGGTLYALGQEFERVTGKTNPLPAPTPPVVNPPVVTPPPVVVPPFSLVQRIWRWLLRLFGM